MTTAIGRGLLAKSFAATAFGCACLVTAARVSNSNEHRDAEFRREVEVATVKAAICDVLRLIHRLVEHGISLNSIQGLAAHGVHVAGAGKIYKFSTDFLNRFGSNNPLMKKECRPAVLHKHDPAIT